MSVAVKERPVLFNGEMVRAILDGRKTQTRRMVKPQPNWIRPCVGEDGIAHGYCNSGPTEGLRCPFGQVGDQLWVREAWGLHDTLPKDGPDNATVYYRSTDGDRHDLRYQKWRPSIHMPRWASRITLEIIEVCVEQLQDIGSDGRSGKAVLAEGVKQCYIDKFTEWFHPDDCPAMAFRELWQSVYGAESWAANPWVWVVEFRKLEAI